MRVFIFGSVGCIASNFATILQHVHCPDAGIYGHEAGIGVRHMSSPSTDALGPEFPWLRRFTKLLVATTLGLIFLGGQVKSNDAGLSVPDWPTSYGENMFTFPYSKWVGGIYYEHLHRLVASSIGLLTVILAVWMAVREPRKWVRVLSYAAVAAVILQGLLGGLTVLMMLPDAISIAHGVLAQGFFVMTIVLAYSQSLERRRREETVGADQNTPMAKAARMLFAMVFLQLFLGAVMRHLEAGLAIPDFPTTAGRIIPWVNQASVDWANDWFYDHGFETGHFIDPVSMTQVAAHFAHRVGAFLVLVGTWVLTKKAVKNRAAWPAIAQSTHLIGAVLVIQISLGALTVWSLRTPLVASVHVVTGALLLGLACLAALRASSLRWADLREEKMVKQVVESPTAS